MSQNNTKHTYFVFWQDSNLCHVIKGGRNSLYRKSHVLILKKWDEFELESDGISCFYSGKWITLNSEFVNLSTFFSLWQNIKYWSVGICWTILRTHFIFAIKRSQLNVLILTRKSWIKSNSVPDAKEKPIINCIIWSPKPISNNHFFFLEPAQGYDEHDI